MVKITQYPRPSFADATIARRRNMAANTGKDTQPEWAVRRVLHRLGYRFRLHAKELPGRPDIVFRGRSKAIEIRGCFWHSHSGCALAAKPKTRADFWEAKFHATIARDARNLAALQASDWEVLVVWECEVNESNLVDKMQNFLGPPRIAKRKIKRD